MVDKSFDIINKDKKEATVSYSFIVTNKLKYTTI